MNSSVTEKASDAWRALEGCEEDGDTAVFTEMGDRFASYVEYYVNYCPDRMMNHSTYLSLTYPHTILEPYHQQTMKDKLTNYAPLVALSTWNAPFSPLGETLTWPSLASGAVATQNISCSGIHARRLSGIS
jgi:hypothetical protein